MGREFVIWGMTVNNRALGVICIIYSSWISYIPKTTFLEQLQTEEPLLRRFRKGLGSFVERMVPVES